MILQTETNVNKLSLKPENRYSSLTNNGLNLSTDFVDNSSQLPIPQYFYPLLKKAKLRLAPKKNGSINSLYALFKMISYGCIHYKSYNPTQESMGNIIKRYGLKDGLCREQVNRLCFELEELGLMRHTTLGINHYYLTELGKQLYLIYSGKNINVTPYIDIRSNILVNEVFEHRKTPILDLKSEAKDMGSQVLEESLPIGNHIVDVFFDCYEDRESHSELISRCYHEFVSQQEEKKGGSEPIRRSSAHPVEIYLEQLDENLRMETKDEALELITKSFKHDHIKFSIITSLLARCDTPERRLAFAKRINGVIYHWVETREDTEHFKRWATICLNETYGGPTWNSYCEKEWIAGQKEWELKHAN